MLIGYARASTQDQNLDLQIEALTKAGCKKVFLIRVEVQLQKPLSRRETTNGSPQGRGWGVRRRTYRHHDFSNAMLRPVPVRRFAPPCPGPHAQRSGVRQRMICPRQIIGALTHPVGRSNQMNFSANQNS